MKLKKNEKARTFPFDNNLWNEFKSASRTARKITGNKIKNDVYEAIIERTRKLREIYAKTLERKEIDR